MNIQRQIRISVNGTLQFTVWADADETLSAVASRASEAMRLGDMRAIVSQGQINFIPKLVNQ